MNRPTLPTNLPYGAWADDGKTGAIIISGTFTATAIVRVIIKDGTAAGDDCVVDSLIAVTKAFVAVSGIFNVPSTAVVNMLLGLPIR